MTASVVNGKIYVIGGHNGIEKLHAVEEYDPATNTWRTVESMPTARAYLTSSVVDGKIYAIGGEGGFSTVEIYDPIANTWQTSTWQQGTIQAFFDDMESGTSNWTADSPWGQITSDCHSSATCWTDSPAGNYVEDLDLSLTSIEFSLASVTDATLTFWHHYDIEEDWDYGLIEVSADGGISWTELDGFTGMQTSWTREVVDLSSYAGSPSVRIRFRLCTDFSITYDGWYVDDVEVSDSALVNPRQMPPPLRKFFTSQAVGDAIYVIGGFDGSFLDTVQEYFP